MVIKKAWFDDEFKNVLKELEDNFDLDQDLDIVYDITGESYTSIGRHLASITNQINNALWDIHDGKDYSVWTKSLIRNLVYKLLYLYKDLKEEKK